MRFSAISAALTLALSVNAASLIKREVSTEGQACVVDLVSTGNQLSIVTSGVNSYTAAQGYAGALTVQAQETTLESKLNNAGTSCCWTMTTIAAEDADAILAEIGILTPKIQSALDTIIAKKSVFDSVALVTSLVKGDINSLYTKVKKIIDCLLSVCPPEYLDQAEEYATLIEQAFQDAIGAYA